jgi:hypothetical protein
MMAVLSLSVDLFPGIEVCLTAYVFPAELLQEALS